MILLIDNYDSFSYNLFQLFVSLGEDVIVKRNDEITTEEAGALRPDAIVLSPGPGRPEDAGITIDVIRTYYRTIPIFGVCLGEQAIAAAFGASVVYANALMHGKAAKIILDKDSYLFHGLGEEIEGGRYHSLIVDADTLPDDFKVSARCEDGSVMAIEHKIYPLAGVQFHPESILTPRGAEIAANFLKHGRNRV